MLRLALRADAAVTGANGLAYLALAVPLSDLLGLDVALLRAAGAFLLAFTALVALTASRGTIPRLPILAIVAVNAIWVADSLVMALAQLGTPSTVGTVWLVAQAVVVGLFAELQLVGLRRTRPAREVASPA